MAATLILLFVLGWLWLSRASMVQLLYHFPLGEFSVLIKEALQFLRPQARIILTCTVIGQRIMYKQSRMLLEKDCCVSIRSYSNRTVLEILVVVFVRNLQNLYVVETSNLIIWCELCRKITLALL